MKKKKPLPRKYVHTLPCAAHRRVQEERFVDLLVQTLN